RSFILPPDVFGPHPTTDGGLFHLAAVPLVNYLTAPFYLFDAMDTLDKIHRPSLVPVTRAAVRIVESTAGVSAAARRAGAAEREPGAARARNVRSTSRPDGGYGATATDPSSGRSRDEEPTRIA